MCGVCWISVESAKLPHMEATPQVEQCCFCRRRTSGGLRYRAPLSQTPFCPDLREEPPCPKM